MITSQYYIPPYNHVLTYKKFDVVYGITDFSSNTHRSPYFYATQDVPTGCSPSGEFFFSATGYTREDDITTLRIAVSGSVPPFAPGSIVKLSLMTNDTLNYTGMILDGGSGTISYINPGWPQGLTACFGQVQFLNPAWTTGYLFQPTYTTKITSNPKSIMTQFGDGYSQRRPDGLNALGQTWNLVYQNRDKREAKAIVNFAQSKAGAEAFEILIPDQFLTNQPNHKYICGECDVTPNAFGLYDITVPVTRVFDL